jgi:GntR family transcriptional regulator, carbon starvation induced regulator
VPTPIPSISTFADHELSRPFDPERSPTKAVAFWLRRDIVRGVFEPMERLKVEPLVQFYGVGHSPVREAIILLSSSGLVVHEHLKGYRVAPVSLADYDDVLAVYQRLYKLTLGMAIDLGDDAWEERVVVQLHRSAKVQPVAPEGDPKLREQWQRNYWELHGQLLSGCGSPLMLQLLGDIGFRVERYVNLFADLAHDPTRDVHGEHREIVETAVSRDKPRAMAAIDRYFASAQPMRESIHTALEREEARTSSRRRKEADA